MIIIELTPAGSDSDLYINIDQIAYFRTVSYAPHTEIYLISGQCVYASESANDIHKILSDFSV